MVRAIVFDVDGTLLNSQEVISEKTLKCLELSRKKGILLYLATARSQKYLSRMSTFTENFPSLIDKGAFCGGAVALDKEIGYSRYCQITSDLTGSIVSYLTKSCPNVHIAIQKFGDKFSFLRDISDEELGFWDISRDDLIPFSKASTEECLRIIAWCQSRSMEEEYITIMHQFDTVVQVLSDSSVSWIQIQSSKATKEDAVLDLFMLRGINPMEVCVFGDSEADVGMFKTFGYSVAMGNAPPSVKAQAKYVTLRNDEDGIFYAFERYLGLN